MKKVMRDIFFNLMFNTPQNYKIFTQTYHFYLKERSLKKLDSLLPIYIKNVIHIRNLKQALNHGLILKKVHRVIKFNQKYSLKPYIDMNTELRQKTKNYFAKDFPS